MLVTVIALFLGDERQCDTISFFNHLRKFVNRMVILFRIGQIERI
jgi:hypothetical protein